jgi:hydroxypyruvate isomerase
VRHRAGLGQAEDFGKVTSFTQGFAWWSFAAAPLGVADGGLLETAARIGYDSVDFLPEDRWREAGAAGLALAVTDGHWPLEVGFNNPVKHEMLAASVRRAVGAASTAGVPFVAVASGDRLTDGADGFAACADGLAPLAEEAHKAGVVLLIEPLNTKLDHPGHACATTDWAARLVAAVGSPGLWILYDFYHAQVMEGDLFRTFETHFDAIAHVHTAGVPGRAELTVGQEVHWTGVADFLRRVGYRGCVTHELIPKGPADAALRDAYALFAG